MNVVYGNEGFRPLNMHRMRALRQMVIEKKLTAVLRFDANPYVVQQIKENDVRYGIQEWTVTFSQLYGVETMCS